MKAEGDFAARYIRDRAREVRRLRGEARAQLRSAQEERIVQLRRGEALGLAVSRAVLVRCMANVYIASALCEALESIR